MMDIRDRTILILGNHQTCEHTKNLMELEGFLYVHCIIDFNKALEEVENLDPSYGLIISEMNLHLPDKGLRMHNHSSCILILEKLRSNNNLTPFLVIIPEKHPNKKELEVIATDHQSWSISEHDVFNHPSIFFEKIEEILPK